MRCDVEDIKSTIIEDYIDYGVVKNKHEDLMKELLKQLAYNSVLHRRICEIEIKTKRKKELENDEFVTIKSVPIKKTNIFNFFSSIFNK